jgi:hypothetical protein
MGNIATKYTEALAGIDSAIVAVPEAQRQTPKFALQVINAILDTGYRWYGIYGSLSSLFGYTDKLYLVQGIAYLVFFGIVGTIYYRSLRSGAGKTKANPAQVN